MKYFLVLVSLDENTADSFITGEMVGIENFKFNDPDHIKALVQRFKDTYSILNDESVGTNILSVSEITPEQLEIAIDTLKQTIKE